LAATHPQLNDHFLTNMTQAWNIKYLGVARFALGCHFEFRGEDGNLINTDNYKQQQVQSVKIHQQRFVEDCVKRFGLQDANTHNTPMEMNIYLSSNDTSKAEKEKMQRTPYGELVGSLNWLAVMTRPDISDAVGQLARHLQNPSTKHWEAARHVLRYLKGCPELGPVYKAGLGFKPIVYSDASFQRCPDTLRSTSGMVMILSGGPTSWRSKRQFIIADSTCEAEYMALNDAGKEGIWLKGLYEELDMKLDDAIANIHIKDGNNGSAWLRVLGDNQGSLALATRPVVNNLSKHINRRWHWIRENRMRGEFTLSYIRTQDMLADMMTKPLARMRFCDLRKRIGIE
jgi:hypothetical protein